MSAKILGVLAEFWAQQAHHVSAMRRGAMQVVGVVGWPWISTGHVRASSYLDLDSYSLRPARGDSDREVVAG